MHYWKARFHYWRVNTMEKQKHNQTQTILINSNCSQKQKHNFKNLIFDLTTLNYSSTMKLSKSSSILTSLLALAAMVAAAITFPSTADHPRGIGVVSATKMATASNNKKDNDNGHHTLTLFGLNKTVPLTQEEATFLEQVIQKSYEELHNGMRSVAVTLDENVIESPHSYLRRNMKMCRGYDCRGRPDPGNWGVPEIEFCKATDDDCEWDIYNYLDFDCNWCPMYDDDDYVPPTPRPTLAPTRVPSPTKKPVQKPTKPPRREDIKWDWDRAWDPPTKEPTLAPTRVPTQPPTLSPTKPWYCKWCIDDDDIPWYDRKDQTPTKKPVRSPTYQPEAKCPGDRPWNNGIQYYCDSEWTTNESEYLFCLDRCGYPRPTGVPTQKPTGVPTPLPTLPPTHEPLNGIILEKLKESKFRRFKNVAKIRFSNFNHRTYHATNGGY